MKLNKKLCTVIADLEHIIGSECYNPNSYDGWNDIEGCDFRYPISFPIGDGEYLKTRVNINETTLIDKKNITPNNMKYIKYKFGSNELFIGLGIIKTLEYLEKRYNLNFNELENNKILNDKKQTMSPKKNATSVPFKMILAYPEKYSSCEFADEQQEILIKENLVLCENNVREKCFYLYLSTGTEKYDYDKSNCMKVYYRNLPNTKKYIMLTASYQKVKIKGKLLFDFNDLMEDNESRTYYFEATKITFL